MKILNWLSTNQGIIVIISTIILAISTLGLMFYTFRLYCETKRTRKIQESPDICVTLEPLVDELCLLIHNQGRASAKSIKVIATPNILVNNNQEDKNINDISIMNLSFLRIDQYFISNLGRYTNLKAKCDVTKDIKFNISYKNENNDEYIKEISINIDEMKDGMYRQSRSDPRFTDDIVVYATSLPVRHIFTLPRNKQ